MNLCNITYMFKKYIYIHSGRAVYKTDKAHSYSKVYGKLSEKILQVRIKNSTSGTSLI